MLAGKGVTNGTIGVPVQETRGRGHGNHVGADGSAGITGSREEWRWRAAGHRGEMLPRMLEHS